MPFDGGAKKKSELTAFLDAVSFNPEFDGADGTVRIRVFMESGPETATYHVPLDQIGVTIFLGGEDNETKVQIVGIKSSAIKFARQATILVPPAYGDDVLVWVKYLTKLKNEYKAWLANRPCPRRVLPREN